MNSFKMGSRGVRTHASAPERVALPKRRHLLFLLPASCTALLLTSTGNKSTAQELTPETNNSIRDRNSRDGSATASTTASSASVERDYDG